MSDVLRQVPLLAELPESYVKALGWGTQEINLKPGEHLFVEGDPAHDFYYLLDGALEITKLVDGKEVVQHTIHAGGLAGQIAIMPGTPLGVGARAAVPSRLVSFPMEAMRSLLNATVEAGARQMEKMAALGKLSAGLAHELNNPAAAARRATEQMRETLLDLYQVATKLHEHGLNSEQWSDLRDLQLEAMRRVTRSEPLPPLEQSDREELVTAWLEKHGVSEAWTLAPVFVKAGIDPPELESVAARVPEEALLDVLAWVGGSLVVAELLVTVEQSTKNIFDLVSAIKAYSRMNQPIEQPANVHDGIENTLTILNHKLKRGITVRREYDRSLPPIRVVGNELNQVWTNLIDNAIDALDNQGEISIRTSLDDGHVLVEIADNGPGIPTDLQCRIFEPFFTTKGEGKGSGLGLDIARRIVTERYHGEIYFRSTPGNTRFWVRLPVATTPAEEPTSPGTSEGETISSDQPKANDLPTAP